MWWAQVRIGRLVLVPELHSSQTSTAAAGTSKATKAANFVHAGTTIAPVRYGCRWLR